MEKLKQLQFLRFLAFLYVFLFHCGSYCGALSISPYTCTRSMGFFFALSGFLTGYSRGKYENEPLTLNAVLSNTWKKVKRFYPLYFFTNFFMLIYTTLPVDIASFNFSTLSFYFWNFLKHAFLLQSWFSNGYYMFNGVGWFLSTILFLSLLNVPTIWLIKRIETKSNYRLSKELLALGFVLLSVIYCFALRNCNSYDFWMHIFPPSRIGEYLGAVALGSIFESRQDKLKSYLNKKKFSATLLEISALFIWMASVYLFKPQYYWTQRIVHWIFPNYYLIFVFAIGEGAISKIFKNKWLIYAGDLSFEFYIIHVVLLCVYRDITGYYGGITLAGDAFSVLFCLMLTIMLASLIHHNFPHIADNHQPQ